MGRRPIIITSLVVLFDDGSIESKPFNYPKGRTLNEQEHITEDYEAFDLYKVKEDAGAVDLWFKDTADKNYKISDAKKNLRLLWKSA